MASSIDWGTLALGALVGVGCRKQIKACGRVAATTVANLAGVAASTAAQVAETTQKTEKSSPEAEAAEAWTQQVYQKIDQQIGNGQKNG